MKDRSAKLLVIVYGFKAFLLYMFILIVCGGGLLGLAFWFYSVNHIKLDGTFAKMLPLIIVFIAHMVSKNICWKVFSTENSEKP